MTQPLEKITGRVSLHGGQPVAFFQYSPNLIEVVRSLPGATWLPGVQGWRISPAAIDMLSQMGFKISPSVLELYEKPKPSLKDFKAKLYPYQAEGVKLPLKETEYCLLTRWDWERQFRH